MISTQLISGVVLAAAVSAVARKARALSPSGAWAALAVGALTFGVGGAVPAVLLLLFFVSSSILSRIGSNRKAAVAAAFDKGGERDAGQVFANGSLAAVASAAYGLSGEPIWLAAVAGALAATTADTWATELGVLARGWPRRILDGRTVEPGTSGAVSGQGILAALGGAGLVGATSAAMTSSSGLGFAAWIGGFVGAQVDSLLGATIQAIYWCPACRKETERHPFHSCGTATTRLRGLSWLRNDGVNFAASLAGAVVAVGLFLV
ncbi:MAG TPA: DUF92 domain-containing protein [Anaerolineales bacterium]|nr:DUF92 domain-containing protein [Anaerolineales bacterium]